jgi:hypothetical protein
MKFLKTNPKILLMVGMFLIILCLLVVILLLFVNNKNVNSTNTSTASTNTTTVNEDKNSPAPTPTVTILPIPEFPNIYFNINERNTPTTSLIDRKFYSFSYPSEYKLNYVGLSHSGDPLQGFYIEFLDPKKSEPVFLDPNETKPLRLFSLSEVTQASIDIYHSEQKDNVNIEDLIEIGNLQEKRETKKITINNLTFTKFKLEQIAPPNENSKPLGIYTYVYIIPTGNKDFPYLTFYNKEINEKTFENQVLASLKLTIQ